MTHVTPQTQLTHCELWASTFIVPASVNEQLARLVLLARQELGGAVYRKDVIAALISERLPEAASRLAALVKEYQESGAARTASSRSETASLTVALPAPVSQRLNVLVEIARLATGFPVMRRDLVSSVVLLNAPSTGPTIATMLRRFQRRSAQDACVKGRPPEPVLSLQRPKPGRRPHTGPAQPH